MTPIIDQYMSFWPALYLPSTGTSPPRLFMYPTIPDEPARGRWR